MEKAEEERQFYKIQTEITVMHKQNENLKDQNDRLLNMNERLMKETENLRIEVGKLRQLFGERNNSFDQNQSAILELQSRIEKAQNQTEDYRRKLDTSESDNSKVRRINDDLELSLKKVVEQNRQLSFELEALTKRRDTDSNQSRDLKDEAHKLRNQISEMQISYSSNTRLVKDLQIQLDELTSQVGRLTRENDKFLEENTSMKKRLQFAQQDEGVKSRLIEAEQEVHSLKDIINEMKGKLKTNETDSANKDREIFILRDEIKQLQSEINSYMSEGNRMMEFMKEKQELVNLNQKLSQKLKETSEEIQRLSNLLREKEQRLDQMGFELNSLKLNGVEIQGDKLGPLRAEIEKLYSINENERTFNRRFNEDNSRTIEQLSRKVDDRSQGFSSGNLYDLVSSLKDRVSKYESGGNGSPDDLEKRAKLQESHIIKLLEQLLENARNSVPEKPLRGGNELPKRQSLFGQRSSKYRIKEIEVDHSDMIKNIIAEELKLSNKDRVSVVKNIEDGTYDCSILDFAQDETSFSGVRKEVKIIRVPCSIIDDLKEINILRNLNAKEARKESSNVYETSAPIPRDLLMRERFDFERKIQETIKLSPERDLESNLKSSRLSNGGETVNIRSSLIEALKGTQTDAKEQLAVIHDRSFDSELGEDFKLITAIINQGMLKKFKLSERDTKHSSCLVNIQDFDIHREKIGQEVFFFKEDYGILKERVKLEVLFNEIMAHYLQDVPRFGKFDIFRQTETDLELTFERLYVEPYENLIRQTEKTMGISQSIRLNKKDLSEVISRGLWKIRLTIDQVRSGMKTTTEVDFKINVNQNLPKCEATVLDKSEERVSSDNIICREDLDAYLERFLSLMQDDRSNPQDFFVKEKLEGDRIVIDLVSSSSLNRRTPNQDLFNSLAISKRLVFDPDSDVYGKPHICMEYLQGSKLITEHINFDEKQKAFRQNISTDDVLVLKGKEDLGVSVELSKYDRFETNLDRFPKEVSAAVKNAVKRNINMFSGLNLELCELLYIVQSENTFYLEKNVYVKSYMKGNNKVFEKIEFLDEEKAFGNTINPKILGLITQRITLMDYNDERKTEWTIEKEWADTKDDFKKVEAVSIDKIDWAARTNMYNFKPNFPKNRGQFEFAQKMSTVSLPSGEKRFLLDKFEISREDYQLIGKVLQVDSSSDGFNLVVESFVAPTPKRKIIEKYNIPKLGLNLLHLVTKVDVNFIDGKSLFENQEQRKIVINYSEIGQKMEETVRTSFTISDLNFLELSKLREEPVLKDQKLSALNELKKLSLIKDKTLEVDGQLIVRERIDKMTNDLIIEKMLFRDTDRQSLVIPRELQPIQLTTSNRLFQKTAPKIEVNEYKRMDIPKITGGLANVVSLLSEKSNQQSFIFMKEADSKLILEKVVVNLESPELVSLVERLTIRPNSSLSASNSGDVAPQDLKIVKETFMNNARTVCSILLKEDTGIPLINGKLKKTLNNFEIYEDKGNSISFLSYFKGTEPRIVLMFFRFLYESHKLNSSYVIKEPVRTEGNKIVFDKIELVLNKVKQTVEDRLFERFTVNFASRDELEISRVITEDSAVVVQETVKLTKRNPSQNPEEDAPHDNSHEMPREEHIKQKILISKGPGPLSVLPNSKSAETHFLAVEKLKPEFEDGINALFEIKNPSEMSSNTKSTPKCIIWEKREANKSTFRRIKIDGDGESQAWRGELIDKIEIRKDDLIEEIMKKARDKKPLIFNSMAAISEREERGCLYSYFVKESYDNSRDQKTIRKISVNESDNLRGFTNSGGRLTLSNEQAVIGVPRKEKEEAQTFVNFVHKAFKNPAKLLQRNCVITEEVREGSLIFERKDVFRELDDEEEEEFVGYVRERVEVDSKSTVLNPDPAEVAMIDGVRHSMENQDKSIESLAINKANLQFRFVSNNSVRIADESLNQYKPLESLHLPSSIKLALKLNLEKPYDRRRNSLILIEEVNNFQILNILSVVPDLETNSDKANPLHHVPLRYQINLDEKLIIEPEPIKLQIYGILTEMVTEGRRESAQITRDFLTNNNQVISERVEVVEEFGKLSVRKLDQRDKGLKYEEWLSPVDESVILKIFGFKMGSTSEVILRRIKEKANIVYEKMHFVPEHRGGEFKVIERYFFKGENENQGVKNPTQTMIFNMSTYENLGKSSQIARFNKSEEGMAESQAVHIGLNHSKFLSQGFKKSIFNLVESVSTGRSLPAFFQALKPNTRGPKLRTIDANKIDSLVLKLIQLMTDESVSRKETESILTVNMRDREVISGSKLEVCNGEVVNNLVDVKGDRHPNAATFDRTAFRLSPPGSTIEKINYAGDLPKVVSSSQGSAPSPMDPRRASNLHDIGFFVKFVTKFYNNLKAGSFYTVSREDANNTIWDVVEIVSRTLEVVRETSTISKRPDEYRKHNIIRRTFYSDAEIEETIDFAPVDSYGVVEARNFELRESKILQKNPEEVYRGEPQDIKIKEKILRSNPFDFENAMNIFLKESLGENFVVSQRIEDDQKIIEKVTGERTNESRIVDRFIMKNSDLIRRLKGFISHTLKQDDDSNIVVNKKDYMKMLGSSNDNENIYFVRIVLRMNKPFRQIIRLLRTQFNPSTEILCRLGSMFLRKEEYELVVEPYLLNREKLNLYETPRREIEYVVVKEFPAEAPTAASGLKDELAGFSMNMSPVYKGQLQNLGGSKSEEEFNELTRLLQIKLSEISRLEIMIRDLTQKNQQDLMLRDNFDQVIREKNSLAGKLNEANSEIMRARGDLDILNEKYKRLTMEMNQILNASSEIQRLENDNKKLVADMSRLRGEYSESKMENQRLMRDLEALMEKYKRLTAEMNSSLNSQSELQRLDGDNKKLLGEVSRARQELSQSNSEILRLTKELEMLLEKYKRQSQEMNQLANSQNDLQRLEDENRRLKNDLSSSRSDLGKADNEIQRLTRELEGVAEKYKRISIELNSLRTIQDSHDRMEADNRRLIGEISRINAELQGLQGTHDELRMRGETARKDKVSLQLEFDELNNRYKELMKNFNSLSGASYESEGLKKEVDGLRRENGRINQEFKALQEMYENMQKNSKSGLSEVDSLRNQVIKLETTIRNINGTLETTLNESNGLIRKIRALEDENRRLTEELQQTQNLRVQLRSKEERVADLENEILLLNKDLSKHKGLISSQEIMIRELEETRNTLTREISRLKGSLVNEDRLRELEDANTSLNRENSRLKGVVTSRDEEIAEFEQIRTTMTKEISRLKLAASNEDRIRDLEDTISSLNKELSRLKGLVSSKDIEIEEIRTTMTKEISRLRNSTGGNERIQELEAMIESLNKEIARLKSQISSKDVSITQLEELRENLSKEISRFKSTISSRDSTITELESTVDNLNRELTRLKGLISTKEERIRQLEEIEITLRANKENNRGTTVVTTTVTEETTTRIRELENSERALLLEINRLKKMIASLESSSVTNTQVVYAQGMTYDEQILMDLKRKNDALQIELVNLKSYVKTMEHQYNIPRTISHSPQMSRRELVSISNLKLTRAHSAEKPDMSARSRYNIEEGESSGVRFYDQTTNLMNFEGTAELRWRNENHRLFMENEDLRNENSKLKSDIITLSNNLPYDLVSLNRNLLC
jgi:chromosome segregation ATPase